MFEHVCSLTLPTDILKLRRNFSLRVLGNVRLSQGRYGDAFTIHKRAFEGQVLTFGDNHFETGVLCHRMGCHYERMGEIETSMYETSLSLQNRAN